MQSNIQPLFTHVRIFVQVTTWGGKRRRSHLDNLTMIVCSQTPIKLKIKINVLIAAMMGDSTIQVHSNFN